MKYFVNETDRKASHSTCYFEFQKGRYHEKHWLPDSVSIRDEVWDELNLSALICSVIKDFDYFGITIVTKAQWSQIVENSKKAGTQWEAVIAQLVPWANACFEEQDVFTILGI